MKFIIPNMEDTVDLFDWFWMYMVHVGLWYFLNVFYKLAYHIINGKSTNGSGWFWGVFIGAFSLLFHYSLYQVGYVPLVLK